MRIYNKQDFAIALVIGLFITLISVIVFFASPTTQDCIDRAQYLQVPCHPDTIRWDEDECECIAIEMPGVELEFDLAPQFRCN